MRHLKLISSGTPTTDGAGVKLTRMVGTAQLEMVDPFLMLDRIDSDDANSYIAGFPDHPHRGFETVTIMLEGQMRHQDSVGNEGLLGPGDVQWMTAGRGIIHSEIPAMLGGRLRGFQLWVNLPAAYKMMAPAYQDIPAAQIPKLDFSGGHARVIAGAFLAATGPARSQTPLRLLDVGLEPDAHWSITPTTSSNVFICIYEGELRALDQDSVEHAATAPAAVVFNGDGELRIRAMGAGAQLLYCEAAPINEPVARYGPFVMNTHAQIEQAIYDYNQGVLATG